MGKSTNISSSLRPLLQDADITAFQESALIAFPTSTISFSYLTILVLSWAGIPPEQMLQAVEMIVAILSTAWGEPMFVHIKAKDPAQAMKFMNVCIYLLPEAFWQYISVMSFEENRTVIVPPLTESKMTKKTLSTLLDTIFENFTMKGTMGILGVLPDIHPSSSSHVTMMIDLDANTSKDFDQLLSYMAKVYGFTLSQLLQIYASQIQSYEKLQEGYKKICYKGWGSRKKINVIDKTFHGKIESLIEDIVGQDTAQRLLRNITRFNHAFVDMRDLRIFYDSQANTETPLVTTSEMDYVFFSSTIKSTLKIWEEYALGLSANEISIIKVVENHMWCAIYLLNNDNDFREKKIPLSAQEKADDIDCVIAKGPDLWSYYLLDDNKIEKELEGLGCHMNFDERQKCYKNLEAKGIIKKLRRTSEFYALARFDLLKDAKFHNKKFEESLMLTAGEQKEIPLQLPDNGKKISTQ
jgi:hypothetical protein